MFGFKEQNIDFPKRKQIRSPNLRRHSLPISIESHDLALGAGEGVLFILGCGGPVGGDIAALKLYSANIKGSVRYSIFKTCIHIIVIVSSAK